jgi:IclR family mhp operon transcriptional activator
MPSGDEMVIQESTHHLSPFSIHRAMVGRRWGYLNTSPGRAYLSYIHEAQLDEMLDLLRRSKHEGNAVVHHKAAVEKILATTRKHGYGSVVDDAVDGISGIAVPLRLDGDVVGAINMVFFSTAMRPSEAAAKHLEAMEDCARRIDEQMRAGSLKGTLVLD